MTRDRFGVLWRAEMAAEIYAHLDRIDVVEVIAEDWLEAPRARRRALRMLASQVPVLLHGVSLGLASAAPVERHRLETLARLCDEVRPEHWSEHLAFVRGGNAEIGHLAAPPRTGATIEGTCRNLEAARMIVGSYPLVENVATLIDPPGSDRDEASFIRGILDGCDADLLLDLHNLHANAASFGGSAAAALRELPPHRIVEIHCAGGRWIGDAASPRLLDDHLHDPPAEVYQLLEDAAARATRPLTVILERDGRHPPFAQTLEQLERARVAVARGRMHVDRL